MFQKIIIGLGLLLGSQLAIAQQEVFQEGVHYFKIDQVQAVTDSDTVEVTEFFSYACSHCNTFEPFLQNWSQDGNILILPPQLWSSIS